MTGQPVYVGKGKGNRMYSHSAHQNSNKTGNFMLRKLFRELAAAGTKPVYAVPVKDVPAEVALLKEQELIAIHGRVDLGTGILFNMTEGGDGVSDKSVETKQRWLTSYNRVSRGRPVSQYSLDGTFIATYPSAKRASETIPTANRSYITQCCKQNRQSAGDFLWAYSSDPAPVYTHAYNTRVEQLTKAGEPVTIHHSVTTAADSVGTSPQAISSACRGKSKTCAGYVWRYIE